MTTELLTIHQIEDAYRLVRQNRPVEPGDVMLSSINTLYGKSFSIVLHVPTIEVIAGNRSYYDSAAGFIRMALDYATEVKNGPKLDARALAASSAVLGLGDHKLPAPISTLKAEIVERILEKVNKELTISMQAFNERADAWLKHIYANASEFATEQKALKDTIQHETAILNAQREKIRSLRDQLHAASVEELTRHMKKQPYAHVLDLDGLAKTTRHRDGFITI